MQDENQAIGQNIISGTLGIGEIIDVSAMGSQGEKFYKVIFSQGKCVHYFSTKNQKNYRILATKEVITNAINIFKSKFKPVEYNSTQEKINIQKQSLKEYDVCKLAKNLSILNNQQDLHGQINKPFNNSLNSFIDEIKFVLDIKTAEAYSLLNLKKTKAS
jgi:RNA polymerase-interacting CarD/CdnL/TRCF family regulator